MNTRSCKDNSLNLKVNKKRQLILQKDWMWHTFLENLWAESEWGCVSITVLRSDIIQRTVNQLYKFCSYRRVEFPYRDRQSERIPFMASSNCSSEQESPPICFCTEWKNYSSFPKGRPVPHPLTSIKQILQWFYEYTSCRELLNVRVKN